MLGRQIAAKAPTVAMLEGTKTHEIAEIGLADYLNHRIEGTDPDIRIALLLSGDPEREERVRGYIQSVFEQALEGSVSGKAYEIEGKVSINEDFGIFGYADFWAAYKDNKGRRAAIVVDLKDGREIVEAETPQLKFLASGLLEEFRRDGIELDYVRAAIYQPRATEDKRYTEVKYSAKQLDTFKSKVLKLAEQVYIKQKYKFKTGKWCRYCKCQEICPEYGKSLENKTSLKLLDTKAVVFPTPETIPDETLRNIVLHKKAFEDFLKAAYKHVMARAIGATPIEGLKLVEGRGRRKIDESREEEIKVFFKSKGIEPFKQKLKGITELKNELHAKKEKKTLVDSYCTEPQRKLILVDESDERPAVANALDLLKQQNEEDENDE